jgi:hypothetical protein
VLFHAQGRRSPVKRYLPHFVTFVAGAATGALLFFATTTLLDDSDSSVPTANCTFPAFDATAVTQAPPVTASRNAAQLTAQARTILGESTVEVHTKVCFKSGATLETAGTGTLLTSGPPWRVLTAAHVVDGSNWEPVQSVEITVRRAGSFQSGFQPAKVTKLNHEADIAELSIEMDEGVSWQSATPPSIATRAPHPGETLAFLCFYEREIRRGTTVNAISRADGIPTYELDVGSGLGCSGAGVLTTSGALVGIVIQSNADVTRVSDIGAFED